MTNPDLKLIAALLDRSGSMTTVADDTRGGFDTFIAGQRAKPGDTVVTLAQFDNRYEQVYENKPIVEVPPLVLEPRGSTALLDAIGRFITDIGSRLAALPEDDRPGDVTVVVMTDGHENASVEWAKDGVRRLIEQQESGYDWDFVFLGANMDAVDVGAGMGFRPGKSMTYAASAVGIDAVFGSVTTYLDRKDEAKRAGRSRRDVAFDEDERRRSVDDR
ncbi:MAG TPA: VWA domain-containing protein [Mycobacterium sp.]|nr:VWA domain-containing protein [Mycobacterium sp.]